jgi:hypothetical protein
MVSSIVRVQPCQPTVQQKTGTELKFPPTSSSKFFWGPRSIQQSHYSNVRKNTVTADIINLEPAASANIYTHHHILPPSRCIRIIKLNPLPVDRTSNDEPVLSGLIRVVSLSTSLEFAALSYVWGTDFTGTFQCDGRSMPITKNCSDALMSIWRQFASADGLHVWVDALCIYVS